MVLQDLHMRESRSFSSLWFLTLNRDVLPQGKWYVLAPQ